MQKRLRYAPGQEQYNLKLYTDYIYLLTEGISLTTLSPLSVLSVKLMWEPWLVVFGHKLQQYWTEIIREIESILHINIDMDPVSLILGLPCKNTNQQETL